MQFNNRLEYQSSSKRYNVGKKIESAIVKCLETDHGYVFEDVDKKVDQIEKIDRYLIENEQKLPVAIKTRMSYSGDDILVDLYEPFKGLKLPEGTELPETKKGRDYKGQYKVYICLSKEWDLIRIIDGNGQKELIEKVKNEWVNNKCKLPVFDSQIHKGVQLRHLYDKRSNVPKILMFIPITAYDKKHIKVLPMNKNYMKGI